MKKLYKSYITTSILKINSFREKRNRLIDEGVDLTEYNSGLLDCIEESIALMCSKNDKEFEHILDMLYWWIYEDTAKTIQTNGVLHDLTNIDDFVDYLLKPIK